MHWDFILILLFLGAAVPWLGRRRIRHLTECPQTTKMDRLTLYASTAAFQWLATFVVLWRARAQGISPADLGLSVPKAALTITVTVALSLLFLINQLLSLKRLATQAPKPHDVMPQLALKIFPQDDVERLAFFALVVTVAVCEELLYRGFVQHIFQVWPRPWVMIGIIGSAIFFALAHLYQGRRGLLSTFVVGTLFSIIRAWTGSLLAPIVTHFVADITVGLLAPNRLRTAPVAEVSD
jgi:uncharacterized protein